MRCAKKNRRPLSSALFLLALVLLWSPAIESQVAKQGFDSLSGLAFQSNVLDPSQPLESIDNVQAFVSGAILNSWSSFRQNAPAEWRATVDQRSGMVAFAEGGNIAWIPGRGNSLTASSLGPILKPDGKVDLATLETIARNYLAKNSGMLGVDPSTLVLSPGRSGQPAGHLWFVDFDVVREGLIVENARVVFRVNNGNLIQFGSEYLPSPGAVVPPTKLTQAQALAAVSKYIGGFGSGDVFVDRGSLHLLPANVSSTGPDDFEFGKGRGLVKVWQFTFNRDGVMGTWQARVDAATGAVLELADVNAYVTAQATGGIFQNSPTTGSEIVRPMPFANVSSGGFTNSAGLYNFTSGTVTSTLNGQYVRVVDTCGAISQASNAGGDLLFGTSAGTDCTTPGHGGAGNTHATREQFYQVNRIKEVGRGWLPSNVWLGQKLRVNVNLNQTCNAYWNGTTLNFFKSGGGCNNTGMIAGVSLHEYGHGLDQNDGTGTAPEGGTGESYGDLTATIAVHSSCVGPGFLGGNCAGYGNACTALHRPFATSTTPSTPRRLRRRSPTTPRCGAAPVPALARKRCTASHTCPPKQVWDFANRDPARRRHRPGLDRSRPALVPVAQYGHQLLHLQSHGDLHLERLQRRQLVEGHARGGRR